MAEQAAVAPASPGQIMQGDPGRAQALLTGAGAQVADFERGLAAAFNAPVPAAAPAAPVVPPEPQRQVQVAAPDPPEPRTAREWEVAKEAIRAKTVAATEAVWQAKLEALQKPNVAELPEYKTVAQRAAELEAKLEAETKARADYERRFKAVALDKHPEWKAKFGRPVDAAVGSATAMIADAALRGEVERALRADPAQRAATLQAVADKLKPWEMAGVMQANMRLAELDPMIAEAKADAERTWQEFEQRQAGRTQVNRNQLTGRFEAKVAEWQDPAKGLELLRERQGDTPEVKAWNGTVQERLARARTAISGDLDPDSYANMALYAAVGPDLVRDMKAKLAENEALRAELAALKQAQPNPGGGGNGQLPAPASGTIPAGMDMGAAMWQDMQKRGIVFPGRR